MQYRKLGRTGLKVSSISLGGLGFGRKLGEAESMEMIGRTVDAGVNLIDTADMYAEGRSEEIIGKALKGKRHSVVLATKVAWRMGPGVNDVGLSRKHIMDGVENSLHRLQTDYIDLYYIHQPDYATPMEETLRTLDDLVHQGKVRYIGLSNFRAWQLCKALWLSDSYNLTRFDCIQPPHNLLTRDIEYELLPLCASEGVGVCVWAPLAGGLLTGKYDMSKPPLEGTKLALPWSQVYYERFWSAANFEAVARLRQIAEGHGCSLTQFALAWVLSNATITSAICGATSVKQLEENLGAGEVKLSQEELAVCDEVWQKLSPRPKLFYGR